MQNGKCFYYYCYISYQWNCNRSKTRENKIAFCCWPCVCGLHLQFVFVPFQLCTNNLLSISDSLLPFPPVFSTLPLYVSVIFFLSVPVSLHQIFPASKTTMWKTHRFISVFCLFAFVVPVFNTSTTTTAAAAVTIIIIIIGFWTGLALQSHLPLLSLSCENNTGTGLAAHFASLGYLAGHKHKSPNSWSSSSVCFGIPLTAWHTKPNQCSCIQIWASHFAHWNCMLLLFPVVFLPDFPKLHKKSGMNECVLTYRHDYRVWSPLECVLCSFLSVEIQFTPVPAYMLLSFLSFCLL